EFFHVVDMFSNDRSDTDVEHLVLTLYSFAMQHPWPENWLKQVAERYKVTEDTDEQELFWLELLREEAKEKLGSLQGELERALAIAQSPDGPYHYGEALEADLALVQAALSVTGDWNALQQCIQGGSLKRLSTKRVECSEEKKEQIKQIRSLFRTQWDTMRKSWFNRSLQAHLSDMQELHPAIDTLTKLVLQFKERFRAEKRARALVDFGDLEHFCLAILLDEATTEEELVPSNV